MKTRVLAISALLITVPLAISASAANPVHVKRLVETKECPKCDLSGAKLGNADLSGANLNSANLRGAVLSSTELFNS